MRQMVEKVMDRYGTDMTITSSGATKTARGFFRAVDSRSWQRTEREATVLGEVPRGQYIYMGPGSVEAKEGDTLEVDGKSYLFRRVEPYYYGNETVYLWGLCVQKGENDTWGTRS